MAAFELYHKQGIRQYRVTDISRKKDHKIVIRGIRKTDSLHCPLYGSKNVSTNGWKERVFIGVPSGNLKTEILRVSWDTIKEIDKKDLQKRYADPPLRKVGSSDKCVPVPFAPQVFQLEVFSVAKSINPAFYRLSLQFQSKRSNKIILSRKGRKEEKSEK